MINCPTASVLASLALGDRELPSALIEHLDTCAPCRRTLATALISSPGAVNPPRVRPPSLLEAGATLGKYRIEGVLGVGAMGVVYVAFEAQLHRR